MTLRSLAPAGAPISGADLADWALGHAPTRLVAAEGRREALAEYMLFRQVAGGETMFAASRACRLAAR